MIEKLRKISFFMLVLVFLAPSIVKLGHHHKEFYCNAKNEKHFHNYHQKCDICQFEFSVLKTENSHLISKNELPPDSYTNQYSSILNTFFAEYSFSLRAPPFYTI
jgi:hypothetical protein